MNNNDHDFCFNNKFYGYQKPAMPINRAMKFGDGIFETMRIIDGKVRYFDLHIKRLYAGLDMLRMNYNLQKINEIKVCIDQLIARNEIQAGGVIRLTVFRAGAGRYSPESNQISYVIESEGLKANHFELNSKGLNIGVAESVEIIPGHYSAIKSLNALPYVMASIEKKESINDDLLLLNPQRNIVEATASNVFLVQDRCIYTPPVEDGCISGIGRHLLMRHAQKLGLKIAEKSINIKDLETANEILLTNAIKGIEWVSSFKRRRYFNKCAKILLNSLNQIH
ncbi:MAG: hypothetical protein CMO34_02445 [Verrucomicrobia bacterium]|nr:hypothetical protein [Verrucomicrobiota bacterium]|tara:strand:- start:361 stop:1203 length:843 start_codon:yes stop_codon:yes gene_type:complete